MSNDWKKAFTEKPEEYIIVHVITLVGKELDVVEAWWDGSKWVLNSIRSSIISTNILAWKYKPEIPEWIRDIII